MPTSLNNGRPGRVLVFVAATVSTVVAIGIVAGVTGLFQSRGRPMEELAAAERACMTEIYVSDRENCMRERVALARGRVIAHQ